MPPTNRHHLLVITDRVRGGGAESVTVDLIRRADPTRFRRSLCLTRPRDVDDPTGSRTLEDLRAEGIELLVLRRRSRLDLRPWIQLMRFLRAEHVDLIHAHKFGSNFWGAMLGRLSRVPAVVAHEHTWSFEGNRARREIDRSVIGRLAHAVIAVSEADRRRMIELVGMPADRIVLIPNGIPDFPARDGGRARQELGIPADAPLLVMTAVLRRQKAIDVMLEAMAVLRRTLPDARLIVAGQGEKAGLVAAAADLGLAEAVSFLGRRSDVPALLAAANVGVLSSDYEGIPLAVLEYMAAALPVVATRVGGLPQLVEEGKSGFLVPARDPEALAAAIATVLADKELAVQMGERGRALQRAHYSSETMARRVYELYDRLLAATDHRLG